MNLEEKFVSSKSVFKGKLLDIYVDDIELPNGSFATREYTKHMGAVCVAPVIDGDSLLFVKQYRYPVGRVVLELPAGKLDVGEEPTHAALRELEEETGAKTDTLIDMGKLLPTPAYSSEIIYLYLAYIEGIGECSPDEDEFLETVKIPVDKAVEMVMSGEIEDAKTQALVLKAALYLKAEKN